jgi:hypothetical protein
VNRGNLFNRTNVRQQRKVIFWAIRRGSPLLALHFTPALRLRKRIGRFENMIKERTEYQNFLHISVVPSVEPSSTMIICPALTV